MTKDLIDQSLIYEELGLSPIWLATSKKEEFKKKLTSNDSPIFFLKRFMLKNLNYLLIAPNFELSKENEFNLFKKISLYLDTLSDDEEQQNNIKQIEQSELKLEINSANSLIFLEQGLSIKFDKKDLTIPYIISISVNEMIKNPEKKRKLWQDIKDLLESIKQ